MPATNPWTPLDSLPLLCLSSFLLGSWFCVLFFVDKGSLHEEDDRHPKQSATSPKHHSKFWPTCNPSCSPALCFLPGFSQWVLRELALVLSSMGFSSIRVHEKKRHLSPLPLYASFKKSFFSYVLVILSFCICEQIRSVTVLLKLLKPFMVFTSSCLSVNIQSNVSFSSSGPYLATYIVSSNIPLACLF